MGMGSVPGQMPQGEAVMLRQKHARREKHTVSEAHEDFELFFKALRNRGFGDAQKATDDR